MLLRLGPAGASSRHRTLRSHPWRGPTERSTNQWSSLRQLQSAEVLSGSTIEWFHEPSKNYDATKHTAS